MIKRVVIKLNKGDLRSGFDFVEVEIKNGASEKRLISNLESAPQVVECYKKWQYFHRKTYKQLNQHTNSQPIEICKLNIEDNPTTELIKAINNWLYISQNFCAVENQLRTAFSEEDEIMVIISTQDDLAWRLPWHLWNFIEDYINAGVVLSHPVYKTVNSNNNFFDFQKVLSLVDNKKNRNDLKSLEKMKNIDLKILSGDELSSEDVLPTITQELDEKQWNILFFAGHSSSNMDNGSPIFYMKPDQPLTIERLKYALKKAISQGLQLAIFNSCDGLGLARELLKINMPKVIVMREDVPNEIAELFLKYFLEFMTKGIPAFLAVRRAREKLYALEDQFPHASLLPVICSNPATEQLVISPDQRTQPQLLTTPEEYKAKPNEQAQERRPIRKRWALLVGVNNYIDSDFGCLKFCVNDVLALEKKLRELNYEVVCLHDQLPYNDTRFPTCDKVESELIKLREKVKSDDLLLVHFACHGHIFDQTPTLILNNTRVNNWQRTALTVKHLEQHMHLTGARRRVLTLDACHMGVETGRGIDDPWEFIHKVMSVETGRSIEPESIHNIHDLAEGFALIAASTAQQRARELNGMEHGIFTYYLLEALNGKADRNDKSFVTVDDIKNYVLDSIRRWVSVHGAFIQEPTARTEGLGDIILADYRST